MELNMELSEFIGVVSKYKRIFFIALIACIAVASLISAMRSQQYEASFSLIVRPKVIEKTNNFQFTDVLEASDRVTRMTENWMNEQGWSITTKRLGNQLITISFAQKDQDAARQQMETLVKKSNEFIASLSATPGFGAFEALGSDFSFSQKSPGWLLSLSMGLVIGIFVGLFSVLFKHYLVLKQ